MQNIDLYFGDKIQNATEKRVLAEVLTWLDAVGYPAVVFVNVLINVRQIDLLVATAKTTLLLEIKGHRLPVIGYTNGHWFSVLESGKRKNITNGYRQALETKYALVNRTRQTLGGHQPPYPDAAVLFANGVPVGSQFEKAQNDCVEIEGIDRLGELLIRPSKDPWPLDWLRLLARELNLRQGAFPALRLTTPSPIAIAAQPEPIDGTLIPNGAFPVAIRQEVDPIFTRVRRAPAESVMWKPANPSAINVLATTPPDTVNAGPKYIPPPARRDRRTRRHLLVPAIAALIALMSGAIYYGSHHTEHAPLAVAAAPQIPTPARHEHHRTPKHARAHRRPVPQDAASLKPDADTVDERGEPSPTAVPGTAIQPSSPTSILSCPPGIDRLGCNGNRAEPPPPCAAGYQADGVTCVRADNP